MNYKIRGVKIEVTEALQDYVVKRLSRIERHFDQAVVADAAITLSVVRDVQSAEVTIPLVGYVLRAEARDKDLYASIDAVVEKLERQIRKHKTRFNRHQRAKSETRGTAFIAVPEVDAQEEEIEVVRNKRFDLKPMSIEEGVMQMNLIGHSFFVFSNEDTNTVGVLYRREDGKYGLIEPNN
jgi:putative sigma-54 modulation protein